MDLGYDGRRVLIIGASHGIGRATAEMMAQEGADLLLAARERGGLDTAARSLDTGNRKSAGVLAVDVTKPRSGEALAEAVGKRWGALDLLVTTVGGSVRSAFADLTDEAWIENYTFNVLSAVRPIRALVALLKAGRAPAIITLGGAAARMPYPHQIVSNVHKAGVIGLTKTLGAELAPDGIRVNSIAPGPTLTRLWGERADKLAAERGTTREKIIAEFAANIPLGRFGEPDEIATVITWVGSPRASFLTGQTINVDGGIARGLL